MGERGVGVVGVLRSGFALVTRCEFLRPVSELARWLWMMLPSIGAVRIYSTIARLIDALVGALPPTM